MCHYIIYFSFCFGSICFIVVIGNVTVMLTVVTVQMKLIVATYAQTTNCNAITNNVCQLHGYVMVMMTVEMAPMRQTAHNGHVNQDVTGKASMYLVRQMF